MKKFVEESWLVLVMGVVFALLLAGTQSALSTKIDDNRRAELEAAIAEVVPAMQSFDEIEVDAGGEEATVYKCLGEAEQLVGWAVQASGIGFIDKINMVVGLSPDGSEILGIKVVEHLETPGLGNKIETKEGNTFPEQFAGKSTDEELVLHKRPPQADNEIQAITGATYSSQYVMDIVNRVITKVRPELPME